ncbi:PPC domain-containing protein [Lysobacter sp. K5869]|uniref:PPC domain-containing protein n=1 Tax=Lysobacter sp. K5869 TaxID=2820808 RepID=UPI001C05F9E0|nr:PPC domain-containing protein [Lysobacter sp. K5869]QWP75601.1 PPC domain-containing protein [Lysobacter sp. K5869]
MRREVRNALRWLVGWAAALTLVSGSAGAAALSAPYVLQGFEWGDGSLEATAGGDGGMLFVSSRNDLESSTVRRYGKDGLLAGSHSMPGTWSDIAANRLGNYVVANVTAQGVYATVFNRDGAVVVPRFQASVRGQTLQVAINDAGLFVIVYNVLSSTPTEPSIFSTYARVFNSNGTARTGELLIASGNPQTNLQSWGLAMDGAGNFIVNQMSRPGTNQSPVQHRLLRYSRDGALLGALNDVTDVAGNGESANEIVQLASNSAGKHIFGWDGFVMTPRSTSARFQRFDASGAKLGDNVLLGRDPPGTAGSAFYSTRVAIAGDGRTLAVWAQRSSFTDEYAQWNVYAHEYAADGSSLGATFRVDAAPAAAVLYPGSLHVAMNPDGHYTVSWAESEGGPSRKLARRYRMEGGAPVQQLSKGVAVGGLSGAINTFRYFRFTVPPNTPNFMLTLAGAGDADMFVKYGEPPTLASYDIATGIAGSNEGASVNNPPPGDFYVGVFGYSAYSNVSLQADW